MASARKVLVGAVSAVALMGLVSPASADFSGRVAGGAFVREIPEGSKGKSQATKTHLSVTGVDDTTGDAGQANYLVQPPKSKPSEHLNLDLDCVVVAGNDAYASGTDQNDDRYYLAIEDNGEPGKNKDKFGIAGDSIERFLLYMLGQQCGAGNVPTGTINGGNYQVEDAE